MSIAQSVSRYSADNKYSIKGTMRGSGTRSAMPYGHRSISVTCMPVLRLYGVTSEEIE